MFLNQFQFDCVAMMQQPLDLHSAGVDSQFSPFSFVHRASLHVSHFFVTTNICVTHIILHGAGVNSSPYANSCFVSTTLTRLLATSVNCVCASTLM